MLYDAKHWELDISFCSGSPPPPLVRPSYAWIIYLSPATVINTEENYNLYFFVRPPPQSAFYSPVLLVVQIHSRSNLAQGHIICSCCQSIQNVNGIRVIHQTGDYAANEHSLSTFIPSLTLTLIVFWHCHMKLRYFIVSCLLHSKRVIHIGFAFLFFLLLCMSML